MSYFKLFFTFLKTGTISFGFTSEDAIKESPRQPYCHQSVLQGFRRSQVRIRHGDTISTCFVSLLCDEFLGTGSGTSM